MTKGKTSNCVLFFRPRNKQSRGEDESDESIYRYARAKKWRIHEVHDSLGLPAVQALLRTWNPIGCLVYYDEQWRRAGNTLRGIPTVFAIESRRNIRPTQFVGYVGHSEECIAELAARHFLTLGFSNFAYLGYDSKSIWSTFRCECFKRAIRRHLRHFTSFTFPTEQKPLPTVRRHFESWLKQLPLPCSVFIANDTLAPELYEACSRLGITIPDQISVISVDDDERICRNLVPPLTSIRLDFRKVGWCLAETLDCLLDKNRPTPDFSSCAPLGIVPRKSTKRPTNTLSPMVMLIQSRIAERISHPIKVSGLIAGIKGCRRSLEIQFQSETGMTILEAVRNARFDHAKMLLADPAIPLSAIPHLCGCASRSQFLGDFHKRFGLTMSAFRKNNKVRHDS